MAFLCDCLNHILDVFKCLMHVITPTGKRTADEKFVYHVGLS